MGLVLGNVERRQESTGQNIFNILPHLHQPNKPKFHRLGKSIFSLKKTKMAKAQPKTVANSGVVDKIKGKKQKRKQRNKLQQCDPSVINKSKKMKILENSEDGKVPKKSAAPSNELQNIKKSNDTISSNWKNLMKNLKNDED